MICFHLYVYAEPWTGNRHVENLESHNASKLSATQDRPINRVSLCFSLTPYLLSTCRKTCKEKFMYYHTWLIGALASAMELFEAGLPPTQFALPPNNSPSSSPESTTRRVISTKPDYYDQHHHLTLDSPRNVLSHPPQLKKREATTLLKCLHLTREMTASTAKKK